MKFLIIISIVFTLYSVIKSKENFKKVDINNGEVRAVAQFAWNLLFPKDPALDLVSAEKSIGPPVVYRITVQKHYYIECKPEEIDKRIVIKTKNGCEKLEPGHICHITVEKNQTTNLLEAKDMNCVY